MNREIKYKYHYTNHAPKVWGLIDIEQGYAKEFVLWNDDIGTVTCRRQYTGLKDCNGKEIYEGDVLEWENGNRANVFYDPYSASYSPNFNNWKPNKTKVIGNIHENPELLEK